MFFNDLDKGRNPTQLYHIAVKLFHILTRDTGALTSSDVSRQKAFVISDLMMYMDSVTQRHKLNRDCRTNRSK